MHFEAETKLAGRIKSVVASLRIDEDLRLDPSNAYDQLDRYLTEVLTRFGQWMRDADAWTLLWRRCYLAANAARDTSKPLPASRLLKEWIGVEVSDQICDDVLSTLKTLPMTYIAYVRLPNLQFEKDAQYELMSGVSLVRSEEMSEPEMFAARDGGERPMGALARHRELGPVYLACTAHGYYTPDSGSSAASNALSVIKQVLYLAEVTGIFRFSSYGSLHANEPAHLFVRTEVDRKFLRALDLPILAKVATHRLAFTETIFAPRGLLEVETPDKGVRLKKAFERASFCLANPQDHTDILTAAEWAFDSQAENNQTLSYLYAAIGLEAILDAPDKDITSVLGDRLAYLIGTSRSERRKIQETFKQFYKHRSKIVHGKKARLTSEELQLLMWAQQAIRGAITRELALVG